MITYDSNTLSLGQPYDTGYSEVTLLREDRCEDWSKEMIREDDPKEGTTTYVVRAWHNHAPPLRWEHGTYADAKNYYENYVTTDYMTRHVTASRRN